MANPNLLRQRIAAWNATHPRQQIDPAAAFAVARQEGLSGGIGDSGHAFGPFQLNNAGGVITGRFGGLSPEQINQWAWSPAGIDYALAGIGRAAGGLRGGAAVRAIVGQFERPANPGRETANALAALGSVPTGGPVTPLPDTGGGYRPSGMSQSGVPMRGLPQALLAAVAAGRQAVGLGGASPLTRYLMQAQPRLQAQPTEQPGPPSQPQPGGLVSPLAGKLIGSPYQGTHGREFNIQGGSNNWESENAVDIAAQVGTPIRAVADGVIGSQFGSLGEGGRFAGLRLHLRTPGNEFYYAHLSRFAPGIKPGVRVRKGQIIGYSGEANGVGHLHFAELHGNPTTYARGH